MYDLNDFIRNSRCITRENVSLAPEGKEVAHLLDEYERVFISDEVVYSGIDAATSDQMFFLKDANEHASEAWWQNHICYVFNSIIGVKNNNFIPLTITVRSMNERPKDHIVMFDIESSKKDMKRYNRKESKEKNIMNSFLSNLYVNEGDELTHFTKEYTNDILNEGLFAINNFASLILSVSLPVLLIVGRLDEKLTENFRSFLEGFLNMFLEKTFKS